MYELRGLVEELAQLRESLEIVRIHGLPGHQISGEASIKRLDYLSTRRMGAVQEETEIVEPLRLQAAVNDVKGGCLFADEQDALPIPDGVGDHVRDRLT